MADVTVKVKIDLKGFERFAALKEVRSKSFMESVGKGIEKEIKRNTARGISSVRGKGRFQKYSTGYEHYITSKKIKRKKPVNLWINGWFMSFIQAWVAGKNNYIWVGLVDDAPQKAKDMFEAHNEGMNRRMKVPQRQFLPTKEGQEFKATINNLIRNRFLKRIEKYIRKQNNG